MCRSPRLRRWCRSWRRGRGEAWATGFGGVEDIYGNAAVGSATQNNTIYGGALGAELALGPHSVLFAYFDGEFSGLAQLYAGKGGFRFTW